MTVVEAFLIQVIRRLPFKGFHLLMERLCTRLLVVTDGIKKLAFCYVYITLNYTSCWVLEVVILYSFKLYFMLGAGACHGLLFAFLMLNECDLYL
jgi:hypothetical protein